MTLPHQERAVGIAHEGWEWRKLIGYSHAHLVRLRSPNRYESYCGAVNAAKPARFSSKDQGYGFSSRCFKCERLRKAGSQGGMFDG